MQLFEKNILSIYGDTGQLWLNSLPDISDYIAKKHNLIDLRPVNNMTFNFILKGYKKCSPTGLHKEPTVTPIILKLGLDIDSLHHEAAALTAYRGRGAAEILASSTGWILLKFSSPGSSLKSYFPIQDDEAISITSNIIKKLHRAPIPINHSFPRINDWLVVLDKNYNLPKRILNKARDLRDQLLESAGADVLLHGDLHHDNIIQDHSDWLVVDPKGVIGDSAYEVAAFLRNPMPELVDSMEVSQIIENRIQKFSKLLDIDSKRIFDWSYVQTVLSWIWTLEDNLDTSYWKKLIAILERSS